MAYLTLRLSKRPTDSELQVLRQELAPLADVQERSSESFDLLTPLALVIGLGANALQIADILSTWLKRAPKGNTASIRLSDGREFKMKANTDPDEFVKQLKAALKNL